MHKLTPNPSFQHSVLGQYAQNIQPFQLKIELLALVVLVVAYFSKQIAPHLATQLCLVACGALALVYYIMAFKPIPQGTAMLVRLAYRLTGVGQATAAACLYLHWIGANQAKPSLFVAAVFLIISSGLFIGIRNLKNIDRKQTTPDLLRISALLFVLLLLYYFPQIGG